MGGPLQEEAALVQEQLREAQASTQRQLSNIRADAKQVCSSKGC